MWGFYARNPEYGLKRKSLHSPVWMNVCFFMSDFWWNLFPQYWHG